MLHITCFDDLRSFGIIALTGESCGLGYRILCDVTERGRLILAKVLGISNLTLPENWNRGSANDPHVGSIMLAPEMMLAIGVFALLESGCIEVWRTKSGSLIGIEASNDAKDVTIVRLQLGDDLQRAFRYDGTARDRNVHAMTGRVE
jgi:hypothetical protein